MDVTVNPKVAMYWSIAVAVLGFLAAGALPSYIPSDVGKHIAETSGWLVGLLGVVQTALHGFSAPQAGPLVKK